LNKRLVVIFCGLMVCGPLSADTSSPGSAGPDSAVHASSAARRQAIVDKLKSIMIDQANFNKFDIAGVIDFLTQKSKELDPEHQGINFVLRFPRETNPSQVTLNLTDIPLSVVLDYSAQQTNLQYTVEDYAVYVHPSTDKEITPPSNAQSGSNSIQQELQSVMISLNFNNATIVEATNLFNVDSKRLDPDHKAINFVIPPGVATTAKPVSVCLKNVPLSEALRYVCLLANVKYEVQEYSISISSR
jgi:hypothetical protein